MVVSGLCHATERQKKQSGGADVIVRSYPTVIPLYKENRTPLNIRTYLKDNSKFNQMTQAVSAKVNTKNSKKNEFSSAHPSDHFAIIIRFLISCWVFDGGDLIFT